jgi:hypothetical protein
MNVEAAIHALADAEVEFIVIGGWSAILNGSPYVTDDLDICSARNSPNLARLAQALAPYRPRLRDLPKGLPFVWYTDIGKIDLPAEVAGLGTFEEIAVGSVVTEAFGRKLRTLDLKSLIKAKRAAGRPKDIHVLPELESLLEAEEP